MKTSLSGFVSVGACDRRSAACTWHPVVEFFAARSSYQRPMRQLSATDAMTFVSRRDQDLSIPLASLTAIALDTETTGLNTSRDRVVQIGAARVTASHLDPADVFDRLVNPGIAIPSESSAIHQITSADVADAEPFAAVSNDLVLWAGSSLVIGYSIGFDLAMLKAEHERSGLSWNPPRSLDVAHLVRVLSPNLPGSSLDIVAAWLEIEGQGRHNALADAIMTAEVFLALLPKLQERGIRTLAQADRACRALTEKVDEEAKAGWHEVAAAGRVDAANVGDYARIDSFPYRHRVREVMSTPPIVVDDAMTVERALALMMQEKVSSVFLRSRDDDRAEGILTERDILRAIDRDRADTLARPVGDYATRPVVTIDQDEFVYRAITGMAGRSFRHLAVNDSAGTLVGALSARDLLRQRADDALSLGDSIERAETPAAMGSVWADLTTVARGLVQEDVDARDIAAVISRELRALTRRATEFAATELLTAGSGEPPVPFAMLVLGSAGRGESLLAMDQDNAIIYADVAGKADVDPWFQALGERAAAILNDAGVAFCKGGVMASNAAWRMGEAGWRQTVADWITKKRPEDILNADIFFDARPVDGERDLAEAIRRDALEAASKSRSFVQALALQAADIKPTRGWFGRFKLDNGRIDLKRNGLMPLFSTARVLALRFQLEERSTPGRFQAAKAHLDLDRTVDNLIEAHRTLLDAILRQQLRDLDRGIALSNGIVPSELTSVQLQNLRWALDQVPAVADLLGVPIQG